MTTLEKIQKAIDVLTEGARKNDSPEIDFLLAHLTEFADDLAEKFEEEGEE